MRNGSLGSPGMQAEADRSAAGDAERRPVPAELRG